MNMIDAHQIHAFMSVEKPLDLQGDVRFIKDFVSGKPLTIPLFIEICKLWTIREVEMMQTYVSCGFDGVLAMSDVQREHIPNRLWHLYFKPSKIEDTWSKTNFNKAAIGLYEYFSNDHQSYIGLLHVLKIVKKNVHGAGQYGSGNLVRICFRAFSKRIPEAPDGSFFRMSASLDPAWDVLKTLNIHTTQDFNRHFRSDYDPGEITYIVCMFIKKFIHS